MSHLRDQNSGKARGTDGEQGFSVDLLLIRGPPLPTGVWLTWCLHRAQGGQ